MQFDISELMVVYHAITEKAHAQNFCFLGKDFQKGLFVPISRENVFSPLCRGSAHNGMYLDK